MRRALKVWRLATCTTAIATMLAGCSVGGSGDAEPPPSANTPVAERTPVSGEAPAAGGVSTVSDGICAADLPDEWGETGVAQGQTPSGARFRVFGNRLADDQAWQAAAELVKADAEKRGVEAEITDTSVRVIYPDGRGFQYRLRLADRYCDVTVSSLAPIPDTERASWPAVEVSLRAAD